MMTPNERSLLARRKAHQGHAVHESRKLTEKARQTFLARFAREVDPHGVLPEDERHRRAEHAKKAYFLGLALKSVQVRAQRKANGT